MFVCVCVLSQLAELTNIDVKTELEECVEVLRIEPRTLHIPGKCSTNLKDDSHFTWIPFKE